VLWIKAFHIIFMVTWFAGLFYLPRLYVYHAMSDDQISHDRFIIMERKLFWGIMTPGAIITVALGLWLIGIYGLEAFKVMGWLHTKLVLVALLVLYHVWCGKLMYDFRAQRNRHGHVWFRWFNEAPVIILIVIVILAEVKPY